MSNTWFSCMHDIVSELDANYVIFSYLFYDVDGFQYFNYYNTI